MCRQRSCACLKQILKHQTIPSCALLRHLNMHVPLPHLQHAAAGAPVVVFDIPLLFETKAEQQLDLVLVVSAPVDVQQQRVLARPGMTPEKLAAILVRQVRVCAGAGEGTTRNAQGAGVHVGLGLLPLKNVQSAPGK